MREIWAGRGQMFQPKCAHSGMATVVAVTAALVQASSEQEEMVKSLHALGVWVARLFYVYIFVISKVSIPNSRCYSPDFTDRTVGQRHDISRRSHNAQFFITNSLPGQDK